MEVRVAMRLIFTQIEIPVPSDADLCRISRLFFVVEITLHAQRGYVKGCLASQYIFTGN
jgi:hypothetical protein